MKPFAKVFSRIMGAASCGARWFKRNGVLFLGLVLIVGAVAWSVLSWKSQSGTEAKIPHEVDSLAHLAVVKGNNSFYLGTNPNPEYVTVLTQALARSDRPLHGIYSGLYSTSPKSLQQYLSRPTSASRIRANALNILADMGTNALPAVPEIIRDLRDPDPVVQMNAFAALRKIRTALGPRVEMDNEVVALLMEDLRSEDVAVRARAASTIPFFGRAATNAVRVLAQMLHKDEGVARLGAISSLSRMGRITPEMLPELRMAAADCDENIRKAASAAIERFERTKGHRVHY